MENSKTENKLECLPFPSKQKGKGYEHKQNSVKFPEAILEKRVFKANLLNRNFFLEKINQKYNPCGDGCMPIIIPNL